MSWSLILACLWAIASAITAMLPMRRQYLPGVTLLVAAPLLLAFLGYQHGIWLVVLGLVAAASMFRNPLIYFGRRALGLPAPLPKDIQEPEQ